jgi:hypothetical protein
MGIHLLLAEVTVQAGCDARDDDPVSNVKVCDSRSDLFNYTDAFVAKEQFRERLP